jgi:hypothetical protein
LLYGGGQQILKVKPLIAEQKMAAKHCSMIFESSDSFSVKEIMPNGMKIAGAYSLLFYLPGENLPYLGGDPRNKSNSTGQMLPATRLTQIAKSVASKLAFRFDDCKIRVSDYSKLTGKGLMSGTFNLSFTQVINGIDTAGNGKRFNVELDSTTGKVITFMALRNSIAIGKDLPNRPKLLEKVRLKAIDMDKSISITNLVWVDVKSLPPIRALQRGSVNTVKLVVHSVGSKFEYFFDPSTGMLIHKIEKRIPAIAVKRR